MNDEFKDTIRSIQALQAVTPDENFKKRVEHTIVGNRNHSSLLFFPFMRFALIFLTFLFLGSGSIVAASVNSKPGQPLYAMKEAINGITTHVIPPNPQKTIKISASIPIPTVIPTITPVAPTENTYYQPALVNQTESIISDAPTPILAQITPTPTNAEQHSSSPINTSIQITSAPVNVNITVGSNAPSGNGDNNTGNNPDAENTSLLPKVNVNTSIIHLGL